MVLTNMPGPEMQPFPLESYTDFALCTLSNASCVMV